MRKISIIAIVFVSVLIIGCSNSDYTKNPSIEQISETNNEEYTIDSSDIYSIEPLDKNSDIKELTENEEKWLIHMREEEKLARDVYTSLGEKWQMNIFMNIAKSEQTHTDSIKKLLDRYGIEDPVKKDVVGEFTLPEIKKLYDNLVKKGSKSLVDGLMVGATIEDLDIFDLDVAINETSKADINIVYANLQKGSRNHMRAFVRQIKNNGATYFPEYISEEVYNSIISSSQERGRIQ